jgi:hypothetical protein
MKKFLWIIPALGLLWIVGYGIHLHRSLSRINSLPGAALRLEPYQLHPYTGPTREINLGYTTFKLPAKWEGELVPLDGLAAIIKRPGDQNLGFLAPASFRVEKPDEFAKSFLELFGEEMPSFHELRKKSVAAQPFSLWDIPRLGRKKAMQEAALLGMKTMQLGTMDRVRLHETPILAVWIESGRARGSGRVSGGDQPETEMVESKGAGACGLWSLSVKSGKP